jgi:L,D-peptidoglycan transpeptidase YkuD (ErfK/YbiS/YcfS/YnhG family)
VRRPFEPLLQSPGPHYDGDRRRPYVARGHLYDLTIVLDYNFARRKKGAGSAIFFHHARPGLTPTAGCVAIRAADMRKLLPRLSGEARMAIG